MAFSGNYMCTSFKQELLTGTHNFTNSTGNTFNIALYTNSASFTASTTAYTATNEVVGSGYTAKGRPQQVVLPLLLILLTLHGVQQPLPPEAQ